MPPLRGQRIPALLHVITYRLLHALRATVARVAPDVVYVESDRVRLATAQMDTLRLRLLKVAAWVSSSVRRILVRLPTACPLLPSCSPSHASSA